MLVTNLINDNGNATANQFVVVLDNGDIAFQSYNSRVCEIRKGGLGFKKTICLGRDYDYSKTTMKYLLQFLRQNGIEVHSINEIRKSLNKGYMCNDSDVAIWYDETMD